MEYSFLVFFSALLGAATANGFQMYVNGPQAKSMPDFQIVTLQVICPRSHFFIFAKRQKDMLVLNVAVLANVFGQNHHGLEEFISKVRLAIIL